MKDAIIFDKKGNVIAALRDVVFLEKRKTHCGQITKDEIPPKLKKEITRYLERVLDNSLAYLPEIEKRINRWGLHVLFSSGVKLKIHDVTIEGMNFSFKIEDSVFVPECSQ